MTYSVIVRGGIYGKAQSFHLKHSLTIRIRDERHTHMPSLCHQNLILCGCMHVSLIGKRVPHCMRMRRAGHSQLPDPLNCARVRIFVRTDTSPSAVELLHHLGVTTLTFACDSA